MEYIDGTGLAVFFVLFAALASHYVFNQDTSATNVTVSNDIPEKNHGKTNNSISANNSETEQDVVNNTNSTNANPYAYQFGESAKTDVRPEIMDEKRTEKNEKGNLNANATLKITSLLQKSCIATSNPCYGTDQDDRMNGDWGPNLIYGKKGNDQLSGNSGNDEMYGEEGDDMFWGFIGDDRIIGGNGKDVLYGGTGNDILDGGPGSNIFEGGQGNDNIYGASDSDQIQGGPGADYIIGGEGDDIIWHGHGVASDQPDGSKDLVDCGPGIDKAWINNEEGDEAHDCEEVNGQATSSGIPP